MTYSVCFSDGDVHGVATATKSPVVGSMGPFVSKNGVVCTQSIVNASIGARTARSLDDGVAIDDAVAKFLADDDHAALRQVHGIDRWGNTVAFTGAECVDWAGDRSAADYTIAGNMLAGSDVVASMESALTASWDDPPVERLLATLEAAERAGGDKRGDRAQSAALVVYHPTAPRLSHDLRVDDHDDPVAELGRLYEVTRAEDAEWRSEFPETVYQRYP